jgi:hypothetical protein
LRIKEQETRLTLNEHDDDDGKNMKIPTYFPMADEAHTIVMIIFFAYKELLGECFTRKLYTSFTIPKCVKLSLEITVIVLPIYVSGDL